MERRRFGGTTSSCAPRSRQRRPRVQNDGRCSFALCSRAREDAVAAMLAAQRALAADDFARSAACRCAWRCIPAPPTSATATTSGRRVNRVARLLAIGHGGQVLVSGVTRRSRAGRTARRRPALRDLGEHRLKDLARPEHVYQLARSRTRDRLSAAAFARCAAEQSCRCS